MNTPTDTTVTPPPATPTSNAETVSTYEQCLALIEKLETENDPANIKAGLNKLKGFFSHRVGKRKSEAAKDGGDAVKSAIAAGRSFKPYEVKKLA